MRGLGVMINELVGDNGGDAVGKSIGKKIAAVELDDDALHLSFEDGTTMRVWDAGQSCCESRYMQSDADLPAFVGAEFLGLEVGEAAADTPDEYGGAHETQFLNIKTSKGVLDAVTHNAHNGYYGGFCVKVELITPPEAG
jgi:hypothetical protein